MGRPEDGLDSFERERIQQEKKRKSEERSKKFWSTFLFTENGKPKSGFLIYTFCLAIAFFAFHYASFYFIIDWLEPVTRGTTDLQRLRKKNRSTKNSSAADERSCR